VVRVDWMWRGQARVGWDMAWTSSCRLVGCSLDELVYSKYVWLSGVKARVAWTKRIIEASRRLY